MDQGRTFDWIRLRRAGRALLTAAVLFAVGFLIGGQISTLTREDRADARTGTFQGPGVMAANGGGLLHG